MFISIKNQIIGIENRIEMIMNNLTAPVEKEIIIETNSKLIKKLETSIEKLKSESSNEKIKEKYSKKLEEIKVLLSEYEKNNQ